MNDTAYAIGAVVVQIVLQVGVAVFWGLVCRAIVKSKHYPKWRNHGFAWGFWLNIIGLIVCLCKSEYKYPKKQTSTSQNVSSNSSTRSTVGTTPTYRSSYSTPSSYKSTVNTGNVVHRTSTSSSPYSSSSYSTRTITKQNFADKVKTLHDERDTKVGVTAEHQKRVTETRSVEKTVKKSYRSTDGKQNIELDMTWSQGLADLIEATELVYTNAELNCQSRLSSEKFQYYINLHYRSFTAADLCHAKLQELYEAKKSFGSLLYNLNDRENPLRVAKEDYDQLSRAQKSIKELISYLETRRDTLNRQTAKIRDKIKDECGTKGITWYNELMERAKK